MTLCSSAQGLASFSREPRLHKRVCPSFGRLVGRSVTLSSAGRDKTASSYCCEYELVFRCIYASLYYRDVPDLTKILEEGEIR